VSRKNYERKEGTGKKWECRGEQKADTEMLRADKMAKSREVREKGKAWNATLTQEVERQERHEKQERQETQERGKNEARKRQERSKRGKRSRRSELHTGMPSHKGPHPVRLGPTRI
jgi:hypothetical protein